VTDKQKLIHLEIINQGAPLINIDNIHIVEYTDNFVAAEIDMHSKWCEIDSTSNGWEDQLVFDLCATDRSDGLRKDEDRDSLTEVALKNFFASEWEFFVINCRRYTVRLVLVKKQGGTT
jgi:hypothetical protein